MIQRQHGVGFAPAEIGLQVHHRLPALATQAAQSVQQQAAQAGGQEGAGVELAAVGIFRAGAAAMNVAEVGGEFRHAEGAALNILVRRRHVAPGFQARQRHTFQLQRRVASLVACLFRQFRAFEFLTQCEHRFHRLFRGNRRKKALHCVQRAGGVVGAECLFVGGAVADLDQFVDETAVGGGQVLFEAALPVVQHDAQQALRVPVHRAVGAIGDGKLAGSFQGFRPFFAQGAGKRALDERGQGVAQRVEGAVDAVAVG